MFHHCDKHDGFQRFVPGLLGTKNILKRKLITSDESCCKRCHSDDSKNERKMWSTLNDYRKVGKYVDVDVLIEDRVYPCHRAVLAASSPYFDCLMSLDFKEKGAKEIKLQGVEPNSFENVLQFIYCNKLIINKYNAMDILATSHYLDIKELEVQSAKFLEKNLTVENVLDVCLFSNLVGNDLRSLYSECIVFLSNNFVELSKKDDFCRITYEVLKDLLSFKWFRMSKDVVLNFLLRWCSKTNADDEKLRTLMTMANCPCVNPMYTTLLFALASKPGTPLSRFYGNSLAKRTPQAN